MSNKKPGSSQPVYAEISRTNADAGCTTAHLMLFGRSIERVFSGREHHAAAQRWVNEWNDHFNIEWMQTRAAAALLMENFTRELQRQGVSADVINRAMEGMYE